MTKRLIQTNFTYQLNNNGKEILGSYLGRKRASMITILRFLEANAKECHITQEINSISIGIDFESPWISR